MKKLPKIYQNNFDKKINNNKTVCYLKDKEISKNKSENIEDVLSQIFNGIGYAFNIPVVIKTVDKIYKTSLISRTKNNIITLDNDIISIADIKNIEILK